MAISAFLDKTTQPSEAELQAALGEHLSWWQRLTGFMLEAYGLSGVMSYGGKKYGWNLWYKRGSKPLLSLYPQAGGMTAQVVLGKTEVEKALALPLREHVGSALRETPAFHDGKWLFLPMQSEEDVEDVIQLIQTKSRPIKKKASA